MTVSTIKMTARQFLELGEDPTGVRLELVDGEVAVSPSPGPRRAYADTKLGTLLDTYITANDLGALFRDVDTIFGLGDVRRPDLIFFAKDRLHLVGETAMEGPPDLCVEIVSPSSEALDRKEKFKQYQKGGVAHYWILDPQAKTIEGYKLMGKKYQLTSRGKNDDIVRMPPFAELDIKLSNLWWKR